eukprot:595528-Rhodomonas_salina.1
MRAEEEERRRRSKEEGGREQTREEEEEKEEEEEEEERGERRLSRLGAYRDWRPGEVRYLPTRGLRDVRYWYSVWGMSGTGIACGCDVR